MMTTRYDFTSTLLPNGKVLCAGGYNGSYLASAEEFDATTGAWAATGPMTTPRYVFTASLLPSGQVLAAGGFDGFNLRRSAELYDPATGTWRETGSLLTPRYAFIATMLRDGKVLAAGGLHGDHSSRPLSSAELYDPLSGEWAGSGPMQSARYVFAAALLPSGNVLAAGGSGGGSLSSAELYAP